MPLESSRGGRLSTWSCVSTRYVPQITRALLYLYSKCFNKANAAFLPIQNKMVKQRDGHWSGLRSNQIISEQIKWFAFDPAQCQTVVDSSFAKSNTWPHDDEEIACKIVSQLPNSKRIRNTLLRCLLNLCPLHPFSERVYTQLLCQAFKVNILHFAPCSHFTLLIHN